MTSRLQSPPRSGAHAVRRMLLAAALTSLQIVLLSGAGWAQKPEQEARQQIRFGTEMAQRGLWNEALFRFRRALELRPEDATIYNNMAVAYEALGLFDEALDNYRLGLRLSPADKALKRNYARFVEFYQRYRPEEDEAAEETTQAKPEGDGAGAESSGEDTSDSGDLA